jgi:GTP cyclohydrolase II
MLGACSPLPTRYGRFEARAYRHRGKEFLAVVKGNVSGKSGVLVRVHDACLTSEAFGSVKCDCSQQLDLAMMMVAEAGEGVVMHLPQEGRGVGLVNKVAAYELQEVLGYDTVDANRMLGLPDDARTYDEVALVLEDIGVESVTLISSNPRKRDELESLGVIVDDMVPCVASELPPQARRYIDVKRRRMRHGGLLM